ncbi:RDD family protein [Streptomyces sp. NPDC054933]
MVTSGGGGEEMPREGYYPDPSIPGYVRYWNGAAWVPGTSRPAPAPGEVLAPPPAAAKSGAAPVTPQVPPRTPAIDESGPMFLDEDPAAPVAETPSKPAWAADPGQQSGVGDAARRVKWGADGAGAPEAATPVAPEGPASGGAAPASGGAPGAPGTAASGAPVGPGGQPAAGGYGFPPPGSGGSAAPAAGVGPQAGGASAGMPAAGGGPVSAGAAPVPGGAPGGFGGQPAVGGAVSGGGTAQAGGAPGGTPAAGGYGYPQAAAGGGAAAPVSHGGQPAAGGHGSAVGPQAGSGQAAAGAAYAYPPQAPVPGGYGYPQAGSDPVPWQRQVQELAGDGGGAPSPAVPWRPPVSNPFLQAQEQARPAATGRRLAARVIDSLLVGAMVAAGTFPLLTASVRHIQDKIDAARQSGENVQVWLIDGTTGLYLGIVLGALLLAGLLYEVLPTAKWGRTLGKKLFNLRVLDIESQLTPGFGQALRRMLVRQLLDFVVVGVVNLVWCLFDRPWRQCWHDKAARTFVAGGS